MNSPEDKGQPDETIRQGRKHLKRRHETATRKNEARSDGTCTGTTDVTNKPGCERSSQRHIEKKIHGPCHRRRQKHVSEMERIKQRGLCLSLKWSASENQRIPKRQYTLTTNRSVKLYTDKGAQTIRRS